jgi:hypothetical protein
MLWQPAGLGCEMGQRLLGRLEKGRNEECRLRIG